MGMKRPTIVAELSANHLGRIERALELVDAAHFAGADGIKVQVWHPDYMCANAYIEAGPWKGRGMKDLYAEAHTPWSWIPAIFERAKLHNLRYFASVFDQPSLNYLEDIGCPAYKIASFELVDVPLIEAVAATGKPIILSTGMADDQEIWQAVKAAGKYASPPRDITLLHCVSAYPALPITMHLPGIAAKRDTFGVPVGLSDHSRGTAVAVAAAALGAVMIEKHFTMRRADGGPDAAFSIEPKEMAQLVDDTKIAWEACQFGVTSHDAESQQRALRRSLFWAKPIRAGETITKEHLISMRPATGIKPAFAEFLIGLKAKADFEPGTPVRQEQFAPAAQ